MNFYQSHKLHMKNEHNRTKFYFYDLNVYGSSAKNMHKVWIKPPKASDNWIRTETCISCVVIMLKRAYRRQSQDTSIFSKKKAELKIDAYEGTEKYIYFSIFSSLFSIESRVLMLITTFFFYPFTKMFSNLQRRIISFSSLYISIIVCKFFQLTLPYKHTHFNPLPDDKF